jgi:lysophospholipase L1-like esterase
MVGEPTQRSLIDRVCNRWHFHHQVDEVLAGELPDVILIWIGHNNVDWVERIPQFHDHAVDHVVEEFQRHFTGQLERLLTRARERTRPTSIVVFGLVNFRAFFRARNRARSEHTSNPDRFPYIDKGHHYFESMKPANTDRMVQLADMYNDSIAGACSVLSVDLPRNLRLVYSDALARVDISESRLISEWDAWHPSRSGHEALATSCLGVVERELEIRAETLQEVETA